MSKRKYEDENVIALGRQFATSGEFMAAHPGEWHAANRRKLLPIIFGATRAERMSSARSVWTFDAIAALRDEHDIQTPRQLLRINPRAHSSAKNNRWFEELFPNWIKQSRRYTFEQCAEAARQCRSRDEFKYRFGGLFQRSRRMGWYYEITAHLPDFYGGFDPSEEGAVYLVRFEGERLTHPVYKVGITNQSANKRLRGFRPAAGINGTVIREVRFQDGIVAKSIEAEILSRFAGQRYQGKKFLLKSGHSECLVADPSLYFDMLVYSHAANDSRYVKAA